MPTILRVVLLAVPAFRVRAVRHPAVLAGLPCLVNHLLQASRPAVLRVRLVPLLQAFPACRHNRVNLRAVVQAVRRSPAFPLFQVSRPAVLRHPAVRRPAVYRPLAVSHRYRHCRVFRARVPKVRLRVVLRHPVVPAFPASQA